MDELNERLLDSVKKNDTDRVIELIEQGANINCSSGYALDISVGENLYEMSKFLLDRMTIKKNNAYPLTVACENSNAKLVELLLNAGIRIYRDAYEWTVINDDVEILRLLIDHSEEIDIDDILFGEEPVKKNILEFMVSQFPDEIHKNIRKLTNQKNINTYKFIKMLVHREIIDIAD
jgi:ankyrin repeat protein